MTGILLEAAKSDSALCELQLPGDLVPPKAQHDMPYGCLYVMGKLKGCTTLQQLLKPIRVQSTSAD